MPNSFDKTFWDEDNILDQMNKCKYVSIIIRMILILHNIIRKYIIVLTRHFVMKTTF